ncbi:MAG: rhamnulose-1-phosphate aldolase [Clostridia bacterium]|nr:rhamnulose-1-phosphate aldolase [Clostridia bacterium]
MMKNILEAPFMVETVRTLTNLYRLGWDERNGGNLSVLLDEDVVAEYLDTGKVIREIPMTFDASSIIGKIFLVTGTGKYFKNVQYDPAYNLGIIKIGKSGKVAELLWGYTDGGRPTSELPAHLLSHITRLAIDPSHRVVMHTHPTNTIAMSLVHSLSERDFTRTLWQMQTESIVVFPEGVAVLPWMVCGTNEIGEATAEKLKEQRLCVWAAHGIYGVGRDLDEAFGLIETVEKAAQLYMLSVNAGIKNGITDSQLKDLAAVFGLNYNKDYLD